MTAPLPTTAELKTVLDNPDFATFRPNSKACTTGCTCGSAEPSPIPVAAYDPIFWAHPCMIDRVWYLWQLQHPGAGPPHGSLGAALAPFSLTVADTLRTDHLGYDDAATTTAAPGPRHHG